MSYSDEDTLRSRAGIYFIRWADGPHGGPYTVTYEGATIFGTADECRLGLADLMRAEEEEI
jgi:hypothetical protein